MRDFVIAVDDPRADDVRALLVAHLEYSHRYTPAELVYALDLDALLHPSLTMFSARDLRTGEALAIGALKHLDETHGELKSTHTRESDRGRGLGRAMVDHLVEEGRGRGYRRLSLETGAGAGFEAARSLYAAAGFAPCGAFADYPDAPTSAFMELRIP